MNLPEKIFIPLLLAESQNFHHIFISQLVNDIAYKLRLRDLNHGSGGGLNWQYYYDMACGGLATDNNLILDIIRDETTNTNNLTGQSNDCN